jgi:hypothetical protein
VVILSAIPALTTVRAASQIFAGPSLNGERAETAVAATLVRRAVAANVTLTALNAQPIELAPFGRALDAVHVVADRCDAIWGPASRPLPVRDLHYLHPRLPVQRSPRPRRSSPRRRRHDDSCPLGLPRRDEQR